VNAPQAIPKYVHDLLKFIFVGVALTKAFVYTVINKLFAQRCIPLSMKNLPVDLHRVKVWLSTIMLFIRGHPSLQGCVTGEYLVAITSDVRRLIDMEKGM
jgi:hypothetical protein